MKKFARLVLFATISTIIFSLSGCEKKPTVPNVLIICVDTLRADHLGRYGYSRNTSPNIDKLAKESALFTRAYSHSPWTKPSVASIFTSLNPKDHGIVGWENPLQERFLTIAEHFKENGYHTEGYVSHITFTPEYGFSQGFDVWNEEVLDKPDLHKKKCVSKELSDLAIAALNPSRSKPFFMFLHYFDPHNDYIPQKDFVFGKRQIDLYDGEIAFTDHHIGRVLKHLNKTGLIKNTIVVFVADHGEEFRDHGGLRHSKTLYEEVLHIPLIIRVPGFKPIRNDTVISEMDIAPTLCNLVNIPVPSEFKGKAINFESNMFNPRIDRIIIAEVFKKVIMARSNKGKRKYFRYRGQDASDYFNKKVDKRGVIDGKWKFIHNRDNETFEFYNLVADPKEQNNLYTEKSQRAMRLKALLHQYYLGPIEKAPWTEMDVEMKEKLKNLGYL